MTLLAIGINHRTAPVEIREKIAFDPAGLPDALRELVRRAGLSEAAILSTCNRTEIYCRGDSESVDAVVRWLGEHHTLGQESIARYLYTYPESEAVRHILRVACGLDSMVLGEPQILGQVKIAYQLAARAGTLGHALEHLFRHSFSVAKQVRTDTQVGASPVSVAFAAVSLAKQIFGDLSRHSGLLVGAGETIELVARHLRQQGMSRLTIANRTLERALQLATRWEGIAITLEEIPAHLATADVVVCATASPTPVIGRDAVERAVHARKRRPIFVVDIAVPRNVEPSVGNLDDVYLYSVDDLREIIEENLRSRRQAATQAEEIIDTQVEQFLRWHRSLDAVSAIRRLRSWADTVREDSLDKARRQLAAGRPVDDVLQQLAQQLTNRLIHGPSVGLRDIAGEGREDLLELLSDLYLPPGNGQPR
jgi:glutamyl-tRNA reductase